MQGFEAAVAQAALDASGGDVEAAVGFLVSARRLERGQNGSDDDGGTELVARPGASVLGVPGRVG